MARRRKVAPGQLPMDFMVPETDWEMPTELPDWRGQVIGLDTETRDDGLASGVGPGWAYGRDRGHIVGVGMACESGSIYVPVAHPETANFDRDSVIRWTRDHIQAASSVVFQNAPYDIGWLGTDFEISVPDEKIEDVMALAVLENENLPRGSYGLDAICRRLGVPGKDEKDLRDAAEAYGYDHKAELYKLPARLVGAYGQQDPVSTLEAWKVLREIIEHEETTEAYRCEMDIVNMVVAMRRRGVRIDVEAALRAQELLRKRTQEILDELSRKLAIGRQVSIEDCGNLDFLERTHTEAGIQFPRTPKTKRGSFKKEWMADHEHWLPSLIQKVEKYRDASEKFIGQYLLNYEWRGRIHAEIHQYRSDEGGTRSYRFSYSNPPLQQMPSRDDELVKLIRGAFLAEHGQVWCAPDYSQQEYRLIVHFAYICKCAGAEKAVAQYLRDPKTDFHAFVADMTKLDRKPAKDSNFAKAFGAGVPKFAMMISKSVDEARAIYDQYDQEMPFVSRLAQLCQSVANRRGFIRLLDGARSHFKEWEVGWIAKEKFAAAQAAGLPLGPCSREEAERRRADPDHPWYRERLRRADTRKAMNRLIQGSAARQTKMAMRQCWREGILPLLQMHDELGASVGSKKEGLRVAEIMRDVVELSIPMAVDADFGSTWGQATEGVSFEEAFAAVRKRDG